MKLIQRIALFICLIGFIMYLPPVMKLTTFLGPYGGLIVFITGWSMFGAAMAFAAGTRYQQARIEKEG